jgi:ABC-2 type transport system permease protein
MAEAARPLPATQARIPVRQTLRDTWTMTYRGVLKFRKPDGLADVILMPIVFTLLFVFIFGGAVSGSTAGYLPVIIPGILVMTVLSAASAVGGQLRDEMDCGITDRLRTLPISRVTPLAGPLLADVVRYAVSCAVTYATGFLLGWRPEGGSVALLTAFALLVFCAWATSWIFAFIGIVARSASTVSTLAVVVLYPLTFLSNAFVPLDTLPGWLQKVVQVNPITQVVTAVGDLLGDGAIGSSFWYALIGSAAIAAVMIPITVWAYVRRV